MESPSPEQPAAKKRKAKPSTAWGGALVSDGPGKGLLGSGRTRSAVQISERDTALCCCQALFSTALLCLVIADLVEYVSSKASQSQVCFCLENHLRYADAGVSIDLFVAAGLAWLHHAKGKSNTLSRSYDRICKTVNVLFLIMHIAVLKHQVCICVGNCLVLLPLLHLLTV